jgi:hypothetical protein
MVIRVEDGVTRRFDHYPLPLPFITADGDWFDIHLHRLVGDMMVIPTVWDMVPAGGTVTAVYIAPATTTGDSFLRRFLYVLLCSHTVPEHFHLRGRTFYC